MILSINTLGVFAIKKVFTIEKEKENESRGCYDLADLRTVVCQIQRKRPVSPGLFAHWMPLNPRSSIFEG